MSRAGDLDQFYTKRPLAKELYDLTLRWLSEHRIEIDCWIEPAAGDGAFFNLLPPSHRLGIDIDPKGEDVVKTDFLATYPEDFEGMSYIAIGNPPFGKMAKTAIAFFNHCAKFCSVIAFIVPSTFCKDSVVNKLNRYWHLEHSQFLPKNSFLFEGQDKDVPCVFQIWIKRDEARHKIEIPRNHPDLEFLPLARLDEATILFQRVGGGAGAFKSPGVESGNSPKSNYYIKCSPETLKILLSITDWETKHWTAGNPSISKGDLIEAYEAAKTRA